MISNKLKYSLILVILISPLCWYIPTYMMLSPNPNYSDLSELNFAPIHNASINTYREVQWLDNESWEFRLEGDFTWQANIPVPSCWNFIQGLEYYEGVAYYRHVFNLTQNWENKSIFLHFRAVNYYCEVTLNDMFLGSHEGGYTPFKFNVTGLVDPYGLNTLIVKVSNVLSSQTIPGTLIGWKNYGGIYREVYLEASNPTYIESNFISHDIQFGPITNASLSHNLTVRNSQNMVKAVNCTVRIFNQTMSEVSSTQISFNVSPYSTYNLLISQNCSRVKLWSPNAPNLHYVNVSLFTNGSSDLIDKMIYRIGFKQVQIINTTLYINQNPFIIKGINRHEDTPSWGKTQPYHVLKHDLDLLKELNINSIRTFHYPNHPAFLEMCDEEGIFIIEEIPAWNIPASDLTRPEVLATGKQQIIEMIQRDFNHPCILFWGVGNEIASDKPEGRVFISEMVETVKSLDPKTPTYFASNKLEDDISFDLVDIIASNPKYGWYYGEISDLSDYLEFWHQKYPNKPVLITEFSAGSQIGDFSGQKFSENYQAMLLQESWNIIISKNYTIGAYVSCFMDYPDLDRMFNPTPFYNQKGVLSYDRSYAKLAFNTTKAMFNETPYLFPVEMNPDPFYPRPQFFNHTLLVILISAFLILSAGSRFFQTRKSKREEQTIRKDLDKLQIFTQFNLFISLGAFVAIVTLFYSIIYTFLKTTTLSLPIFEIEEKIILNYLITDGILLFLPYLILYYFVLTAVITYGLARLIKTSGDFTTLFFSHLKTAWIFLICIPLYLLTYLGLTFFLILCFGLIIVKIILDLRYLSKNLSLSRKKTVFLKIVPILILFGIFLLYLQIRFDIINLLSLLL